MRLIIPLMLLLIAAAVLIAAWRVAYRSAGKGRVVLTSEQLAMLEDVGFFEHVGAHELHEVRAEVARTSWPFWVRGTRRFLLSDAEDLAEGGVAHFVDDLRPLLRGRGVDVGEVTDLWETDYRVRCENREFLIWSAEEAAREREQDRTGLVWGLATARAFALVNRMLRKAGSPERLYAVAGGNDLQAFLLTPNQAQLVAGFPTTAPADRPYLPDETYPWFGQPHDVI